MRDAGPRRQAAQSVPAPATDPSSSPSRSYATYSAMRRSRRRVRLSLLLPLLLLWTLSFVSRSAAQMESPLKGQGIPQLETTQIFVSSYLDRLLAVNEDDYRWEAVLYFYLSWTDATAAEKIDRASRQMYTNSSYSCKFMCSNVDPTLCCDDMFLPSFFFKNAYGFPQDRAVMYSVYLGPDGGVMWEVRVHGIFYQPLDFSHFPFDAFDLLVELRFYDPTVNFDESEELLGGNHTGIVVVPSSGGKKIYTIGRGDDASSWAVTDFSVEVYSVDFGDWFADFSDLPSDADDPLPLNPSDALLGSYEDGTPINVFSGVEDQLLGVYITVERFWKPSLINTVLPVILVFLLGLMIFFLNERSLDTRLEVTVALFLSLTAVQFVVVGELPTSSYIVPTQQLVLATYVYLFLLAAESITVYHIVCWHEKKQAAKRRKEAWLRYRKLKEQGMLAGGQNPTLAAASSRVSDDMASADLEESGGAAVDQDKGGEEAHSLPGAGRFGCFGGSCFGGSQDGASHGNGGLAAGAPSTRKRFAGVFSQNGSGKTAPVGRTVSSLSQMTADEAFGLHLGHWVDRVSAVVLGVGYSITAILIFTLQSGYIVLFPE